MIGTIGGIAIALSIACNLGIAYAQCSAGLSPFIDGAAGARMLRISEMHGMGQKAIPMLLPEIENTGVSHIRLENPFLSYRPFTSPTLCGAVAAYLIEMVLGKTSLSIHEFEDKTNFLIQGDPENYVYGLGYIIDVGNGKPIDKSKLRKIAGLYGEWWETNADKSLESMRDDWRRGNRPLTGSEFDWR